MFVDRIARGTQPAKAARGESVQFGNTCSLCGAWRGQLGLEPTIEMYIGHMLAVFREVWRVLRDDGTLWLNMGDSYSGSGKGIYADGRSHGTEGEMQKGNQGSIGLPVNHQSQITNLKSKDLCGIPWRLAFALQAAGWYLRSDIIWAKPNPMPESVTDRPTKAHEYIFLLTKSQRYFYDADAVKEDSVYPEDDRKGRADETQKRMPTNDIAGVRPGSMTYPTRNLRSVWEIPTQPYAAAHFATFPEEIARRCIAAGTSERGVCPSCAAPWERITIGHPPGKSWTKHENDLAFGNNSENGLSGDDFYKNYEPSKTTGWRPTCSCRNPESLILSPALVLDPFGGSGTVGEVALKMGRRFVLIDLAYQNLQRDRIGLFAHL